MYEVVVERGRGKTWVGQRYRRGKVEGKAAKAVGLCTKIFGPG